MVKHTKFILYLSELLKEPSIIKFTDDNKYEILGGFLVDYKDNIIKVKRRNKKAIVEVTIAGEKQEITVSFIEDTELQMPEQKTD